MKKLGFTLIEAVVALLIMGIAMTALFKTQGELLLGTSTIHGYFERLFVIKNYFITAQQNRWYNTDQVHQESLQEPEILLEYKILAPRQGILQDLQNLSIERVDGSWQGWRNPVKESLLTFNFALKKAS